MQPGARPAQVAQLVEHLTENQGVGGSNPPLGTIRAGPRAGATEALSRRFRGAFLAAATLFRKKSAAGSNPDEFKVARVKLLRFNHLRLCRQDRPEGVHSLSLDTTFVRPISYFADRDCDQGSQPNPPVQETRPSDRSLKRAKSRSRGGRTSRVRVGESRLESRARWQEPLGAGDTEAQAEATLTTWSSSRRVAPVSRRLPRGRRQEAKASWRQIQGGGFREANGSEIARQQRKADRQLKRFTGRRFGGFVVRPDQLSDEVPPGRQVGGDTGRRSPRDGGPQSDRFGGASRGAGHGGTTVRTFRPPEPEG